MPPNDRCYCNCHSRVIDPQASEEESCVLRVLEFMHNEGYSQLQSFLDSYFASDNQALKMRRVGMFFSQGGFRKTFHLLSHHTSFSLETRVKASSTATLKEYIGEDVVHVLKRILTQELNDIQKSGVLRLPADGITPADAEKLDFETLANIFFDKTPLTARIIFSLFSASRASTDSLDLTVPADDIAKKDDSNNHGHQHGEDCKLSVHLSEL
jgi:hypothetical protein